MKDWSQLSKSLDFQGKHLLAIDYGEKVTGTATFKVNSDPYPLPFIKIIFQNQKQLLNEIHSIIENECVDVLIIGVPYLTDGQSTNMTKKIEGFYKKCCTRFKNIDVFQQDETLSSFEAEKRMLNSPRYHFKINPKEIDCLAASIILEDFIKS